MDFVQRVVIGVVVVAWLGLATALGQQPGITQVTEHCWVVEGAINGAAVRAGDRFLAVYGWDGNPVDQLLLTHGRRDVVWRAESAARHASVTAPVGEKYFLQRGGDYWTTFPDSRFHDYAQQTTKMLDRPMKVDRWVAGGDQIRWRDLEIDVLETPGYTRGSVSYVVEIDGKRIGFTGDLIYGDGQILDLYSFQDAIPQAQVRGYHGYGARLADLVTSLDRIIAADLDTIIPARGPVIGDPTAAARRLKSLAASVYRNYLSTSALHWYFKEQRMRACGQRVLGDSADIELMPYAHHESTPDWIYENSTSRLLLSDSGRGFLLDCGYQRVIDAVQQLIDQEVIEKVDGIFVTHFHDDHTDCVQAAAEQFDCPVYATGQYADLLERPSAYHLPAMTANPISGVHRMTSGQSMRWHEFEFTFHDFPGQTYFHGALLVKKDQERPVFFIGDSFAPSGIDDYCLQNRNLLHDDQGYLLCLQKVRDAQPCWLINEHINYVFEFSEQEMEYLEQRYRARREILAELFPWDDPNYGVDEQWAVLSPRGLRAKPGDQVKLRLRVWNHSPRARSFRITPHLPAGLSLVSVGDAIELQPRAVGGADIICEVAKDVASDDHARSRLVTVDIDSDGMRFRRWADALITVQP